MNKNLSEQINWYGAYVLSIKESQRFLKVYNQTIIAPGISALIFLSMLVLAMGHKVDSIQNVPFIDFIGYGLIIMSIVQNAFANSSSSLIMSKVIGYISDVIVPPFSGVELLIAYCVGSLIRGIVVGGFVALCLAPFIDFHLYHPLLLMFFTVFSCLLLGQLGILAGIFSSTFDQHSAITSYLITPLSFLSGTFYSVERLPHVLKMINKVNPFFYMIDGFRYSLTNHADSDINTGICMLLIANITLAIIIVKIFNSGWRIKD